jgi:outer membrane protein OmpA-like peptidoglycan-associated protein
MRSTKPSLAFGLITAASLLAGCSSWPAQGQGGLAAAYPDLDYYEMAATNEVEQHTLVQQLEIQQTQLDVMVMQGANQCLPASVRKLSQLSTRIRREIQGQLMKDAANDLVALQFSLRSFRLRFYSLAAQTQCDVSPSIAASDNGRRFVSLYFDHDDAELSLAHQSQLAWIFNGYSDDINVHLRGFTDRQGDEAYNQQLAENRLNTVSLFVESLQGNITSLSRDIQGEGELLLHDNDDFANGMNRRVDVYIEYVAPQQTGTQRVDRVQQWGTLPNLMPSQSFRY